MFLNKNSSTATPQIPLTGSTQDAISASNSIPHPPLPPHPPGAGAFYFPASDHAEQQPLTDSTNDSFSTSNSIPHSPKPPQPLEPPHPLKPPPHCQAAAFYFPTSDHEQQQPLMESTQDAISASSSITHPLEPPQPIEPPHPYLLTTAAFSFPKSDHAQQQPRTGSDSTKDAISASSSLLRFLKAPFTTGAFSFPKSDRAQQQPLTDSDSTTGAISASCSIPHPREPPTTTMALNYQPPDRNTEMNAQHEMKESLEQSCSSVVISINDKLDATSPLPQKCTIFRVHELLRRENEMAYEPEILAIGPYHRGGDRLQVMEDQKLRLLKASLEQLGQSDANKYVEAMKRLEPEARRCYSENTSHVNDDDFVEMMLLDGFFIIQFMRRSLICGFFKEGWVIGSLLRDMMIFENQIPLFVLEKLFSMIRLPNEVPDHFHELALHYFKVEGLGRMFPDTISTDELRSSNSKHFHHILGFLHDLLRSAVSNNNENLVDTSKAKWNLQHAIELCEAGFKFIITHSCRRRQRDRDIHNDAQHHKLNTEFIPSAAKLHAAGVELRSKRVRSIPFEISFNNGVMEIPSFSIHDSTDSLYRNLIAYEQYSQKPSDLCVVLHATLMDCLIDSPEDVALLRKCGIIGNGLGDDQAVSTIFNKLVNNVTLSKGDYDVRCQLFEKVNAYCGKRRHQWMATLRREYFNSPWALISFFAAVFLLVLTLVQTVFSVLGVL